MSGGAGVMCPDSSHSPRPRFLRLGSGISPLPLTSRLREKPVLAPKTQREASAAAGFGSGKPVA